MSDKKVIAKSSFSVVALDEDLRANLSTTTAILTCDNDYSHINTLPGQTFLEVRNNEEVIPYKYIKVDFEKNHVSDHLSIDGNAENPEYKKMVYINGTVFRYSVEYDGAGLIKIIDFTYGSSIDRELGETIFFTVSLNDAGKAAYPTYAGFEQRLSFAWTLVPAGAPNYIIDLSRGTDQVLYVDSITTPITTSQYASLLNKLTVRSSEYALEAVDSMAKLTEGKYFATITGTSVNCIAEVISGNQVKVSGITSGSTTDPIDERLISKYTLTVYCESSTNVYNYDVVITRILPKDDLMITGDQVFTYENDFRGIPSPETIYLSVVSSWEASKFIWEYSVVGTSTWTEIPFLESDGEGNTVQSSRFSQTGNSALLTINHNSIEWLTGQSNSTAIKAVTYRVHAEGDSAYDYKTIYKVSGGGDAYTIFLTNQQAIVECDENGNLTSDADVTTQMRVFRSKTEYTYIDLSTDENRGKSISDFINRYTITTPEDCNYSVSGGTVRVSSSVFKNNDHTEIPIYYETWDGMSGNISLHIYKNYQGVTGAQGEPALVATLSNDNYTVQCDQYGDPLVGAFALSESIMTVMKGDTDISEQTDADGYICQFSVASRNCKVAVSGAIKTPGTPSNFIMDGIAKKYIVNSAAARPSTILGLSSFCLDYSKANLFAVSESSNNSNGGVYKINIASGETEKIWQIPDFNGNWSIEGICIDELDNIYLCIVRVQRVIKLEKQQDGTYVYKYSGDISTVPSYVFQSPIEYTDDKGLEGIAWYKNYQAFVANQANPCNISLIDTRSGKIVKSWDFTDSIVPGLQDLSDLEYIEELDEVWAIDSMAGKVFRFGWDDNHELVYNREYYQLPTGLASLNCKALAVDYEKSIMYVGAEGGGSPQYFVFDISNILNKENITYSGNSSRRVILTDITDDVACVRFTCQVRLNGKTINLQKIYTITRTLNGRTGDRAVINYLTVSAGAIMADQNAEHPLQPTMIRAISEASGDGATVDYPILFTAIHRDDSIKSLIPVPETHETSPGVKATDVVIYKTLSGFENPYGGFNLLVGAICDNVHNYVHFYTSMDQYQEVGNDLENDKQFDGVSVVDTPISYTINTTFGTATIGVKTYKIYSLHVHKYPFLVSTVGITDSEVTINNEYYVENYHELRVDLLKSRTQAFTHDDGLINLQSDVIDTQTIPVVSQDWTGVSIITNPTSIAIPASEFGGERKYEFAFTRIIVLNGQLDVTNQCLFEITNATNVAEHGQQAYIRNETGAWELGDTIVYAHIQNTDSKKTSGELKVSVTYGKISEEISIPWSLQKEGSTGVPCTYAGKWRACKKYVCRPDRVTVVRHYKGNVDNTYYYKTKLLDKGAEELIFGAQSETPTYPGRYEPGTEEGSQFWEEFGSQFESVATSFLFADDAYINDLVTSKLFIGNHYVHDENGDEVMDEHGNPITEYHGWIIDRSYIRSRSQAPINKIVPAELNPDGSVKRSAYYANVYNLATDDPTTSAVRLDSDGGIVANWGKIGCWTLNNEALFASKTYGTDGYRKVAGIGQTTVWKSNSTGKLSGMDMTNYTESMTQEDLDKLEANPNDPGYADVGDNKGHSGNSESATKYQKYSHFVQSLPVTEDGRMYFYDVEMYYVNSTSFGILGAKMDYESGGISKEYFHLGSYNRIAGWNFDEGCLYRYRNLNLGTNKNPEYWDAAGMAIYSQLTNGDYDSAIEIYGGNIYKGRDHSKAYDSLVGDAPDSEFTIRSTFDKLPSTHSEYNPQYLIKLGIEDTRNITYTSITGEIVTKKVEGGPIFRVAKWWYDDSSQESANATASTPGRYVDIFKVDRDGPVLAGWRFLKDGLYNRGTWNIPTHFMKGTGSYNYEMVSGAEDGLPRISITATKSVIPRDFEYISFNAMPANSTDAVYLNEATATPLTNNDIFYLLTTKDSYGNYNDVDLTSDGTYYIILGILYTSSSGKNYLKKFDPRTYDSERDRSMIIYSPIVVSSGTKTVEFKQYTTTADKNTYVCCDIPAAYADQPIARMKHEQVGTENLWPWPAIEKTGGANDHDPGNRKPGGAEVYYEYDPYNGNAKIEYAAVSNGVSMGVESELDESSTSVNRTAYFRMYHNDYNIMSVDKDGAKICGWWMNENYFWRENQAQVKVGDNFVDIRYNPTTMKFTTNPEGTFSPAKNRISIKSSGEISNIMYVGESFDTAEESFINWGLYPDGSAVFANGGLQIGQKEGIPYVKFGNSVDTNLLGSEDSEVTYKVYFNSQGYITSSTLPSSVGLYGYDPILGVRKPATYIGMPPEIPGYYTEPGQNVTPKSNPGFIISISNGDTVNAGLSIKYLKGDAGESQKAEYGISGVAPIPLDQYWKIPITPDNVVEHPDNYAQSIFEYINSFEVQYYISDDFLNGVPDDPSKYSKFSKWVTIEHRIDPRTIYLTCTKSVFLLDYADPATSDGNWFRYDSVKFELRSGLNLINPVINTYKVHADNTIEVNSTSEPVMINIREISAGLRASLLRITPDNVDIHDRTLTSGNVSFQVYLYTSEQSVRSGSVTVEVTYHGITYSKIIRVVSMNDVAAIDLTQDTIYIPTRNGKIVDVSMLNAINYRIAKTLDEYTIVTDGNSNDLLTPDDESHYQYLDGEDRVLMLNFNAGDDLLDKVEYTFTASLISESLGVTESNPRIISAKINIIPVPEYGRRSTDSVGADWIEEWSTSQTYIDSTKIMTPKLFAGVAVNGNIDGVAIGNFQVMYNNIPNHVNGILGVFSDKNGVSREYFRLEKNYSRIAGWMFTDTQLFNLPDDLPDDGAMPAPDPKGAIVLNSDTKSIEIYKRNSFSLSRPIDGDQIVPTAQSDVESEDVQPKAVILPPDPPVINPPVQLLTYRNDSVKMYYTDKDNWGLRGVYFNTTKCASKTEIAAGEPEIYEHESFHLGSHNHIAHWNFDEEKLYKTGIVLACDETNADNDNYSAGIYLSLAKRVTGSVDADNNPIYEWYDPLKDGKSVAELSNIIDSKGGIYLKLKKGGNPGASFAGYDENGKVMFKLRTNSGSSSRIANWYFNTNNLWIGTLATSNLKDPSDASKGTYLGYYATTPGSVVLNNTGIRSCGWRLEQDGSGALAKDNIRWDTTGNVTFAESVKLAWSQCVDADGNSISNYLTKIDANGIYTGTISANNITSGTISTVDITSSDDSWALKKDGTGWLAKNNIQWDADGSLSITGQIHATSGTIGGFKIGSNYIESTGSATLKIGNSDFNVVMGTQSYTKSVQMNGGINSIVIVPYDMEYNVNNVVTMRKTNDNVYNWQKIGVANVMDIAYHTGMYSTYQSPNRYGLQYAMLGTGHVIMDAIVEGGCFDAINNWTDHGQWQWLQLPMYGNRIIVRNMSYDHCGLILPDKYSVFTSLGCKVINDIATKAFTFRLDIINTGAKAIAIAGRNAGKIGNFSCDNEALPYLRYNGTEYKSSLEQVKLNGNRIMSLMLMFDGVTYMAFIINSQHSA